MRRRDVLELRPWWRGLRSGSDDALDQIGEAHDEVFVGFDGD
jgi:hypothetical protein